MLLSLANDVKENWKHLKDVILEVGYQHLLMCVGGHKQSSFPRSWFEEERKRYLKLISWRNWKANGAMHGTNIKR